MTITKMMKKREMKTLAYAKIDKRSSRLKKVLESLGYLNKKTALQNLIINNATCPIILNTLSTITDN
jgi:hypothetical protein